MRILLASVVAIGLAGCSTEMSKPAPAPAPVAAVVIPHPMMAATKAPICAKPAEKVAFAMAALRMQLSITELSCDARERFNDFTVKFRNDVGSQNKTLGTYFNRAYGKRGVSQQDEYETSQINQMSQMGTQYGTGFCAEAMPMYDQVLALKNGSELADYAVSKNFDQTLTMPDCAEAPTPPAKSTAKPVAKEAVKTATKK